MGKLSLRSPFRQTVRLAFALGIMIGAVDAPASDVLVVRNDIGGRIRVRAEEVARLRADGTHVEIRKGSCLSSCTMYLGLPDVCVDPKASFGFHGPNFYGAKLSQRDFDYWSEIIAKHYPEPLRSWYMQTGRHRVSFFRISGAQLIELGVAPC